jgi:glycosyltransferase involved in cell wall biosynthesis
MSGIGLSYAGNMKVLHICCVAPPQGGGMGKAADTEVRLLRARGVEAWLAAPFVNGLESEDHVIRLPAWSLGNAAILRHLQITAADADIVHLHYPFYGTAGQVARLRHHGNIKHLAVTLHMDAQAAGFRGALFGLHRRWLQPRVLSAADVLFVSSLDYAAHSSFSSLTAKPDPRLVELPFGVDVDRFSPTENPPAPLSQGGVSGAESPLAKRDFGELPSNTSGLELVEGSRTGNEGGFIPDHARIIGTVSVMDEAHAFKGLDVLLRAAVGLPEDVHLLLVGDGNRRAAFEQLARDLGIAQRVHFTGRLKDDRLPSALRRMDVFAFPSTSGAEAFGLAMLEAMACGVPAVASDLPGVRSVADGAGLIVPPNDEKALRMALMSLLDDAEGRKKFSEAARAKAQSYTWDAHIDKLIHHYQELCASRS